MLCVLHGVDTGLEMMELDAADASAQGVVIQMGLTSDFTSSGKYNSWSGGKSLRSCKGDWRGVCDGVSDGRAVIS